MTPVGVTRVVVGVPLTLDPTPAILAAAERAGREVSVGHRPDLLPPQRFVADHRGVDGWQRSLTQQDEWEELLAGAQVLLGVPGDSPAGLAGAVALAPGLRWIQHTAAGAGEALVKAQIPPERARDLVVTSSAGVHGASLAEFALFGLLAMAKDADRLRALQADHAWGSRWVMRSLAGQHVLVIGMGSIGRQLARRLGALDVRVTATRRGAVPGGEGRPAAAAEVEGVADWVDAADATSVLPDVDAVVLALPGTADTRAMVDADWLARLPPRAVLVNVGRGSVVDTAALVEALAAGGLRGAVLDVTDPEPLGPDSPLWDMPQVILSPHTAALTEHEDDDIVSLFADNLTRYLSGDELRNTVAPERGY